MTIDDIYDPQERVDFSGSPPRPHWLKDGTHYLVANPPGRPGALLQRMDARTGEPVPFYDAAKMEAALAALPGISPVEAEALSMLTSYQMNPAQTAFLINHDNDLFYYQIDSGRAVRLTSDVAQEVEEDFSPDGRMVSFIRNNNLYAVDVTTAGERQITRDGNADIKNGLLDWVYEEELYGRGNRRAYWWSPDSKKIAFLQLDDSKVHKFTIISGALAGAFSIDYPQPGGSNPIAAIKIAEVGGTDSPLKVDVSAYAPEDLLIVRVGWTPDGKRVIYQAQNREQTYLDLNAADPSTGKSGRLFRETTKAWVEAFDDNPRFLKDGSFIWRSERTGWSHLYGYSADGKLIKQITSGPWEVRGIDAVDEDKGLVYFHGTEHSHIAEHVYRVRMDGAGLKRLSDTEGNHNPSFNPTATMFVNRWSDVNTPVQVRLFATDGKLVRVIDENRRDVLKQFKLGKAEFKQVKTRDGFLMEALMIRPPDFDPSKKYPVLTFTYGGPHAPMVSNVWGGSTYMWHQMLAQKGYIIWMCDNRSASGKGAQSTWQVYKNFGELELRDIEDGLAWLKSQPYVDGSRVGIWGWSYGGFMTSYAMTHSKSFKIGIAGGSHTDWRDYDSIFTERYMQSPDRNPEGYRKSSVSIAAAQLSGKLLLLHGAIDDNVHVQNSLQFAYALKQEGKQSQLIIIPQTRHGVTTPNLLKQLRTTMTNFILQNL